MLKSFGRFLPVRDVFAILRIETEVSAVKKSMALETCKKIAVFCDSEFWHGYNWEERKKDFKSHQEFWIPKIERNMERDAEVTAFLESEGWTVIRFGGNEIKKNTAQCADIIEKAVHSK